MEQDNARIPFEEVLKRVGKAIKAAQKEIEERNRAKFLDYIANNNVYISEVQCQRMVEGAAIRASQHKPFTKLDLQAVSFIDGGYYFGEGQQPERETPNLETVVQNQAEQSIVQKRKAGYGNRTLVEKWLIHNNWQKVYGKNMWGHTNLANMLTYTIEYLDEMGFVLAMSKNPEHFSLLLKIDLSHP